MQRRDVRFFHAHRMADLNRAGGGRLGAFGMKFAEAGLVAFIQRIGFLRLAANESGQAVDQAEIAQHQKAAADRGDVAEVGRGELQLGGELADRTGAIHRLGDSAAARHLADVLAEVADGDAAIAGDLAFV